ncbi:hypothetical protein Tco_0605852 [Tanacetum coccineum]
MPTSPVRDTPAPVTESSPISHVVRFRTRMTVMKSVMGLKLVMTPTRSASLCLPRARPSSHSSGLSLSASSSSSDPSSSSESSPTFDIPSFSLEISSHSSSDTDHTLSGPLPHRRQQCSDYVTPSSSTSVGPSEKRCRSSATSVPATTHPSGALSLVLVDLLPPRKRFRGSSAASSHEYSIEDSSEAEVDIEDRARGTIEIDVAFVAEPEVPDDLPKSNIAKRLDQHEEAIQGMYEHLLDLPALRLKDIEEEQRDQSVKEVTAATKRANLLERVTTLEGCNMRL